MEQTKVNIRQLEIADIERFIGQIGEKSFRVKQIHEWLWQKHAHSFDEMTNLSKDLRQQLEANFTLPALTSMFCDLILLEMMSNVNNWRIDM